MTKRNGNFNGAEAKKLKFDDTDDLWDDDLDLEDCLLQATQACEKAIQENNVSVLPNYSFFQHEANVLTSTQTNSSRFNFKALHQQSKKEDVVNVQEELKRVREENIVKNGEVTLLREQIKKLRCDFDSEKIKKDKEVNEKLQQTFKDLATIRSELDFKNLEIANLKNKLNEVSKTFDIDGSKKHILSNESIIKLYVINEKYFPLKNDVSLEIFLSLYVDRSNLQVDEKITYDNFNSNCIFPFLSYLISCDWHKLNSDDAYPFVNKIYCVNLFVLQQFLKHLDNYLNISTTSVKNLEQTDLNKFFHFNTTTTLLSNKEWCVDEIGIKARQIITVTSEILLYNKYLQSVIVGGANFWCDDNYFKLLIEEKDVFVLILTIVRKIGKLQLSEQCVGVLSSVIKFLTNVSKTEIFSNCYERILQISNEINILKPPEIILEYLSEFLRETSQNLNFVNKLCNKPVKNAKETNENDFCFIKNFVVLFENYDDSFRQISISRNTLHFVKNVLNLNVEWMHLDGKDHRDCTTKIIFLAIKLISNAIGLYKLQNKLYTKDLLDDIKILLNNSVELLHIIKFKCLHLIMEDYKDFQFKYIIETLINYQQELEMCMKYREILQDIVLELNNETPSVVNINFSKCPLKEII